MLIVRFPNGQTVQYNDAYYCIHADGYHNLYESKQCKKWIATVPMACIVEAQEACRIYNSLQENENNRLEQIEKELRAIKRKIGKH